MLLVYRHISHSGTVDLPNIQSILRPSTPRLPCSFVSFFFLVSYSLSPTRPLPSLPPSLSPSLISSLLLSLPHTLSPSPRSCPAVSEERANLFLYEPVVERFSGHQLVVGSFLNDHAFLHNDDLVGRANRRQAVSDHDARAAFLCSFQGLLHELTPTSRRQRITSISEANATSCLHS